MKYKIKKFKNCIIDHSLKIKNLKLKIILFIPLLFLPMFLIPKTAYTQNSSNNNYNLEINDINTAPEESDNSPHYIPLEQSPITEEKTKGGIKSIAQEAPLFFSVSSNSIDFGALTPGNPVIRNTALSILSSSVDYQIISFEDHPLSTTDNQIIADTTCDNGACTELVESEWKNQLTYGLGFKCESRIDFLCIGFSEEDNYKQFADLRKLELPQTIITGSKSDKTREAQISLKLNTSGGQKNGSYSNTVTFILVPNY